MRWRDESRVGEISRIVASKIEDGSSDDETVRWRVSKRARERARDSKRDSKRQRETARESKSKSESATD